MPKPDKYIRIADVNKDGQAILNPDEGAVEYNGIWYVIDDQIKKQSKKQNL